MSPDASPPASADVLLDVHEGVATVTLNRPDQRNAVSWQLMVDLVAALEEAGRHPDVRVLVLTGAGSSFCVGADMRRAASDDPEVRGLRTLRGVSVEDDEQRLSFASTAIERLVGFPAPTVAAINGGCAGAGLCIALATDLQVAVERAVINTAFLDAGVPGDLGSAWLLTRAVGGSRARALLLDPGKMSASEAASLGLVTEVTHDLDERVGELARKLASRPRRAMQHARRNLEDAARNDLAAYLQLEVPRMVDCAQSSDAKEAARAFGATAAAAALEDRSA